ncbi:MAG: aspartate aminotransferase family protein [Proteobacteria bacterium]|nr:aspartate aminotransferase family protein [Pseudomonadota bacterium]
MPHLLQTYDPLHVTFTEGEGLWLTDDKQQRYLDAISGIGVTLLGHNHPEWVEQAKIQAGKLVHVSNMYQIPEKSQLAQKLCQLAHMDKVFFANSGSEANETAIKLARLYGNRQHITNPTIIVFENAFHGRTLATLSASGHRQVQAGFEPLSSGFIRVPFGDINALKQIAQSRHDVVALMIEPIQGAGGIHIASNSFLQEVRHLCNDHHWLLISDEIQTGVGRTGKFLCVEHAGIQADVVTLAKGLANGIAIGACLTKGIANELFTPDKHGSTLGGNPFACAMALKTLEIIEKENLMQNAALQGDLLLKSLNERLGHHPQVKSVRGKGLMLAVECKQPCKPVVKIALKHGLLINVPQPHIIRLLPPLVIQPKEIEQIVNKLEISLDEFAKLQSN